MADMVDFNKQVITEFHENEGKVGGMFEGMPLLLLHHVGAKSGAQRIAPLVYLPHGDKYVIFASKGGAPENPAWFHNLKSQPETSIEVGTEIYSVQASEATGEERDSLYAAQVEAQPQFAEYEAKTTRKIPVVVLTPEA